MQLDLVMEQWMSLTGVFCYAWQPLHAQSQHVSLGIDF